MVVFEIVKVAPNIITQALGVASGLSKLWARISIKKALGNNAMSLSLDREAS